MSDDRLGVAANDGGLDAAVFSSVARGVELCLFDDAGREERVALERDDAGVWRGRVEGPGPGQRYGFRVDGPYDPARGSWCDPAKLLLDPYAMALEGPLAPDVRGFGPGDDTAAVVPRCVVARAPSRGVRAGPRRPWSQTVIYEAHVRTATIRHPGVPAELRGTYLGLCHEAFVEHLASLGVTAIELLPVAEWLDEPGLAALGLTDDWGYNPIAFLAPTRRYARSGFDADVHDDVATMVDTLHEAGLEVLLDVVYNHTAEGGDDGSTLSLRGLDAAAYYRVDGGHFNDTTGCGNSLNADHPVARALVCDALAHWVQRYGVDGFRFDLAVTLGRSSGAFDPDAPLLAAIRDDPRLAGAKLVVEPWDLGDDGYCLGRFTAPYHEWNGAFRDDVRDAWRGAHGSLGGLATRLAGSRDVVGARGASASINYVTSHDGFTLADLVAYDRKHNDDNGEGGSDGTDDNRSWNSGAEGPSDDPDVLARRVARSRALLATLLLSRGTPMLLCGDEVGRTQDGNNNAYCQDRFFVEWVDVACDLRADVAALTTLRREVAELFEDDAPAPSFADEAGGAMAESDWDDAHRLQVLFESPAHALALLVNATDTAASFTVARSDLEVVAIGVSPPVRDADGAIEVPAWTVAVLAAGLRQIFR